MNIPGLPILVLDTLLTGHGAFGGRLLGLVTVAAGSGPETDGATMVRYLSEAITFPYALLPSDRLRWEGVSETSARAALSDRGRTDHLPGVRACPIVWGTMPLPKRPHVASPEQVRITRDGDNAVIEYADSKIATTHLKMGAKRLAAMTDADVLTFWNEHLQANQELRDSYNYVATEVPVGKPQVEYFEEADQWVARGGVLRCQIVTDAAVPVELDEPVVSIDGRDFTTAEFIKLLGGHGGWGMRIVFVPDDELHERPKIRVREPAPPRKARRARSRMA